MATTFRKISENEISIIEATVSEPVFNKGQLNTKLVEINEQINYYQGIVDGYVAQRDKIQSAKDAFDVVEIGVEVDTKGLGELIAKKPPILEEELQP